MTDEIKDFSNNLEEYENELEALGVALIEVILKLAKRNHCIITERIASHTNDLLRSYKKLRMLKELNNKLANLDCDLAEMEKNND